MCETRNIAHPLSVAELGVGERLASGPGRLNPGWVDPRVGLEDLKKQKNFPFRESNQHSSVVQPVH
jgi:hypothetical protein